VAIVTAAAAGARGIDTETGRKVAFPEHPRRAGKPASVVSPVKNVTSVSIHPDAQRPPELWFPGMATARSVQG